MRVSGSIALSGVAEKMKAHWKPGLWMTKKGRSKLRLYEGEFKILEN
jgi:hypothetical protein